MKNLVSGKTMLLKSVCLCEYINIYIEIYKNMLYTYKILYIHIHKSLCAYINIQENTKMKR